MIALKRPPVPDFLSVPGNQWLKETNEAILHYTAAIVTKQFEFKRYRDAKMKMALKGVFTKCAYCESIYADVYDGDIEHFRPKGRVSEKTPQTPGYYWLANDWDNLLLSCLLCNQSRKHQLYGETIIRSRGKLDQFPLSDETKRVHSPSGSLEEEEKVRLLLHPCKDEPEKHFDYDLEFAVMIPLSAMGRASLEVYVLHRPDLVASRQKVLTLINRQAKRVTRELDLYLEKPSEAQKQILKTEYDYLLEFADTKSEYAGMARFVVRQFIKDNNLTRILK